MAQQWELHVHGQRVVVKNDVIPVLIGRSFDRPVLAVAPQSNAYVSRHHCEVRAEDGELWCMDLGSSNGTWIKRGSDWIRAAAHERVKLQAGDQLTTIDQTPLCDITGTPANAERSTPPTGARVAATPVDDDAANCRRHAGALRDGSPTRS